MFVQRPSVCLSVIFIFNIFDSFFRTTGPISTSKTRTIIGCWGYGFVYMKVRAPFQGKLIKNSLKCVGILKQNVLRFGDLDLSEESVYILVIHNIAAWNYHENQELIYTDCCKDYLSQAYKTSSSGNKTEGALWWCVDVIWGSIRGTCLRLVICPDKVQCLYCM